MQLCAGSVAEHAGIQKSPRSFGLNISAPGNIIIYLIKKMMAHFGANASKFINKGKQHSG